MQCSMLPALQLSLLLSCPGGSSALGPQIYRSNHPLFSALGRHAPISVDLPPLPLPSGASARVAVLLDGTLQAGPLDLSSTAGGAPRPEWGAYRSRAEALPGIAVQAGWEVGLTGCGMDERKFPL